jgi:hypothetical protein
MGFRQGWTLTTTLAIMLFSAGTASAQQTLNFSLGYFTVRGEDARHDDDVLLYNRENLFVFDFSDFNSASLGAEWLVPIGEYAEIGAGVGFTRRTVPTIYADFTQPGGAEIEQELKLRNVPFSATVRVLPLGRGGAVQPYVGGGIGVNVWRYSETGDFIDFSPGAGNRIFRDAYVATGTAIGPVAVFGLRIPVGSGSFGGEIRYQKAEGDLDELDFLAPKIDLGGFHYVATFGIRF